MIVLVTGLVTAVKHHCTHPAIHLHFPSSVAIFGAVVIKVIVEDADPNKREDTQQNGTCLCSVDSIQALVSHDGGSEPLHMPHRYQFFKASTHQQCEATFNSFNCRDTDLVSVDIMFHKVEKIKVRNLI